MSCMYLCVGYRYMYKAYETMRQVQSAYFQYTNKTSSNNFALPIFARERNNLYIYNLEVILTIRNVQTGILLFTLHEYYVFFCVIGIIRLLFNFSYHQLPSRFSSMHIRLKSNHQTIEYNYSCSCNALLPCNWKEILSPAQVSVFF